MRKILFILIVFNLRSSLQWEASNFIWNYGIAQMCDFGLCPDPINYFSKEDQPYFDFDLASKIKDKSLVWINVKNIKKFINLILPKVSSRYILVTGGGDETFPDDCQLSDSEFNSLVSNNKLVAVFAQNCSIHGFKNKFFCLPIGIDFHSAAYKSSNGAWGHKGTPLKQEHDLSKILSFLAPTNKRFIKAYVDFQHSDTLHGNFDRYKQLKEDRLSIFKTIKKSGKESIASGSFKPRVELWKTKGMYAFSVSPHGNGLDCHRTWEDLVLGCIVIVKKSPLDPMYEGLPVVIVNDWSEVNLKNMRIWLTKYKDVFNNFEYRLRLTNDYWISKMRQKFD